MARFLLRAFAFLASATAFAAPTAEQKLQPDPDAWKSFTETLRTTEPQIVFERGGAIYFLDAKRRTPSLPKWAVALRGATRSFVLPNDAGDPCFGAQGYRLRPHPPMRRPESY